MLSSVERFKTKVNNSMLKEVLASAGEWEKQLYMIPEHALTSTFEIAENDKNGLVISKICSPLGTNSRT